jgi:DNA-binding NarL/FixJ family response regulator
VIANLAASLAEAEQRERFVCAALASLPKEPRLTPQQATKAAFAGLSEREREVAWLVAQGHSNRQIAAALVISQRTVGTHLRHLYAKLGVSTRMQLATWAREKGEAHPIPR